MKRSDERILVTHVGSLPRPRELTMRDAPEFTRYTGRVRELFMQHGVFRGR